MLDRIDRKLLYLLDRNCRQSATQLGKALRIHRNVVLYRMRRLEETGVIRGYFTEVDLKKLGFSTFRLFLRLGGQTPADEQRLVAFLAQLPQTIWLFQTKGRYDIDLVYATQDQKGFSEFLDDLNMQFNSIIEERRIGVLVQIHHFTKDYLVADRRASSTPRAFEETAYAVDGLDEEMLLHLADHAKTPFVELARLTQRSINTIKERLRTLEKKKVILAYRPFIDTEKTGYTYYKLHMNLRNYTRQEYLGITAFFAMHPGTVYFTKYLNGDDLEIELHLKGDQELETLLGEVRAHFGKAIRETYVLVFAKEHVFRNIPATLGKKIGAERREGA